MSESIPATGSTWRWRVWSAVAWVPLWAVTLVATLLVLTATAWGMLSPIVHEQQAIRRLYHHPKVSIHGARRDACFLGPRDTWEWIIGEMTGGGTWAPDTFEVVLNEETPKESLHDLRFLRHVDRLSLTGKCWSDADLACVAQSFQLDRLSLDNASITPAGWDALRGSPIAVLSVDSCRLGSDFFAIVRTMPQLKSLFLFDCDLTDSRMEQLSGHPNVESVWLKKMPLLSNTGRTLGSLPRLRYVVVSGETIGDEFVSEIGRLSTLTDLSLFYTAVTDAGLKSIPAHLCLESLELRGTAITEAGLLELRSIPKHLDLVRTRVRLTEPLRQWFQSQPIDTLVLEQEMLDDSSTSKSDLKKYIRQVVVAHE